MHWAADADYRSPPAETYHVAELASDGKLAYATTAHASQLKSWKVLHEEQSDLEDGVGTNEGEDNPGDEEATGDDGNLDPVNPSNDSRRAKRTRRPLGHLQDYVLD